MATEHSKMVLQCIEYRVFKIKNGIKILSNRCPGFETMLDPFICFMPLSYKAYGSNRSGTSFEFSKHSSVRVGKYHPRMKRFMHFNRIIQVRQIWNHLSFKVMS